MAGISSSAVSGIIVNKYKANGGTELGNGEWADGSGLELYETTFRSFNAQIGRFVQVDPLLEGTASIGGYSFGNNNPANFVDPMGTRATNQYQEKLSPCSCQISGGAAGGGGGYYNHKDANGNMWHHADALAGIASQAQQYEQGYGVDGFGDATYGGGGIGRGRESGKSSGDYSAFWAPIGIIILQ